MTPIIKLTRGSLPLNRNTRADTVISRNTPGKDTFLFNFFTTGTARIYDPSSVTFRMIAFMYLFPPRLCKANIDPKYTM